MPALRIEVDDVVVATVSTAGMTMIDVRLANYYWGMQQYAALPVLQALVL